MVRLGTESHLIITHSLLGITWAFTVAICSLAFVGKFGGCTIAARFAGFSWRESSSIGTLMSCKGYVTLLRSLLLG